MGKLILQAKHRLLCGDSTKTEHVARLMAGNRVDLCFTSPPYAQQRDYTGEAQHLLQDWDALMQGVFANLPMAETGQVLVNLGLIHRDGEWQPYWNHWLDWMRQQGWRRFGWYVWDQGSGLPGDWSGRLAPSHEFVFHFNRTAVQPHKHVAKQPESIRAKSSRNVGLRSQNGELKPVSNPAAYAQPTKIADSVIRINRSAEAIRSQHPAVFPVALALFVLQSWPGAVYDPFLGSGTTLIAAEQLGRSCYGLEISPQYCDVIVQRWEQLTGRKVERISVH